MWQPTVLGRPVFILCIIIDVIVTLTLVPRHKAIKGATTLWHLQKTLVPVTLISRQRQ